jgi:predicted deacylase
MKLNLNKLKYDKLLLLIFIIIIISLTLFYLILNNPRVYTFSSNSSDNTIFILGSVHGNEPAGTKACYKLIEYFNENPPKDKVIIMPMPNLLGYYVNSRYQLKPFNSDINRNFSNEGKDRISKIILKYVREADLIVDLHEGYEYHIRYPKSMGSSVIPNKSKSANDLAHKMVESVNMIIKDKDKKFVVSNFYDKEDCYLPDSLACYSNRNNKNYISIETTGLNPNKQNIDIRVEQMVSMLRVI